MINPITLEEKIAYTECYDIIMYLRPEEKSKIPDKLIDFFKTNMFKEYISKINPYVSLEYQTVSTLAKNIITCIYREYLADEEEKKWFKEKDAREFDKLNKEFTDEDYKALFNSSKKNNVENNENTGVKEENEIKTVENYNCNLPIKKMNFFEKIFDRIKRFFKR